MAARRAAQLALLFATCSDAHVVRPATARPAVAAVAKSNSPQTTLSATTRQDIAATNNQAYESAKQKARDAAYEEQRALEEWRTAANSARDQEDTLPEAFAPEVASGGVSGVLGFCSGRACRAVGEAAALSLGATFVFVSLLSRAGYVTIHYTK
eukprot:352052-Prymnesium_polylepis.1